AVAEAAAGVVLPSISVHSGAEGAGKIVLPDSGPGRRAGLGPEPVTVRQAGDGQHGAGSHHQHPGPAPPARRHIHPLAHRRAYHSGENSFCITPDLAATLGAVRPFCTAPEIRRHSLTKKKANSRLAVTDPQAKKIGLVCPRNTATARPNTIMALMI